MTFKGKSTIELRNAKTGELEFKTKDENMVTNATFNLMNGLKNFPFGNSGYDYKSAFTPLLKNCFSGLLLFDKNITEEINVILPPRDVLQVGCASGAYVGADINRGSLNLTETKDLENGYRFVWDFNTDKANGTFRCAALTSYAGGCGGARQTDYGSSSVLLAHPSVSNCLNAQNNSSISTYAECNLGSSNSTNVDLAVVVGNYEKDVFLFAGTVPADRKGVLLTKRQYANKIAYLKKENATVKSIATKPMTTALKFADSWNFVNDDTYLYSIYPHDKNQIDFIKINGTTLDVVEEKTITVQDADFLTNGLVMLLNDKLYVEKNVDYSKISLYEININDPSDYKLLPEIALRRDNSVLTNIGENLAISSSPNRDLNCRFAVYVDGIWCMSKMGYSTDWAGSSDFRGFTLLNTKFLNPPYMFVRVNLKLINDWYFWFKFGVYIPFLSTINNLSTPVVKNETQTMKVTYEITEI